MKRPTNALDLMVDRACGITDADWMPPNHAPPATVGDLRSVECPAGAMPILDPFDPSLVEWHGSDDEAAFLFAGGMRLFCRACGGGLWAFGNAFPGWAVAAHYHPPSKRA